MIRIPSIPSKKVKEAIKYAEDVDNWLDMDLENDITKYSIKHRGMVVTYIIEFRNVEDRIGPMPERHISFTALKKLDNKAHRDFIKRTLNAFAFEFTEEQINRITKASTQAHFYSFMFKFDD